MIDIETLGRDNGHILQIAAVLVENRKIKSKFFLNINWKSHEKYNFKLNLDTINWWFKQSDKARKSVSEQKNACDIKDALEALILFLNVNKNYPIFQHSSFDCPIIRQACNLTRVDINQIKYSRWKDLRTVDLFLPNVELERKGIYHNALDDSLYQAEYLIKQLNQYDETTISAET